MNNSILIGKVIYRLLTENEEVSKIVGNKVFPIVAKEGTKYPFVAYLKNGIYPTYCKDGVTQDAVSLEVVAVSDKYVESLELGNAVRKALECKRYKDEDIHIRQMRVESIVENFVDDAYVQSLLFNIIIN